ncbi:bifunctional 6-phosphofructo-2-kinase fructose-2,6-bisphosphate 2-phosphatase [Suillus subalutaceus]|uniref:bifunctional 6-phosphofructo-2-kinase fructose-2,6-bisphosphate 2-phosphatase n=1 Tax=Suillus subalutaceus TaxID=48586 RepID=UPI001B86EAFF|nr:bifunctional 6-phosphofructo-2-kinase fructose-2,6-bisphosphate 2-phosphatase [Suillus subalutaceus]KAG1862019.1 bifunctional 6-phosphofructo-2-kinase fructose-2,6-bisphosphate 2-phosphatase [Suillus subalutaceus]
MAAPLYTTASGLLFHAGKILILTVGLPARGKTHISRALERYLRWMGVKTQVVSLGDYRRKTLGGAKKLPPDYFTLGEKSPETMALRKMVSDGCEKLIGDFFESGGQVVIYDANNGSRTTRQALAEKYDKQGIHVIILESVCDNNEIIETNIRNVKISSPDYRGWDPDKAVQDYYERIRDREKSYETVEETTWPFIRIINVGEKMMVNNIRGYLQSRIVFFLMNIHNRPRMIYFARSGQSLIEHSYKADSDLSPAGWEYSERLKEFVVERRAKSLEQRGFDPNDRRLVIWTSTRRRAHHTAWPFLTPTPSTSIPQQLPLATSHLTVPPQSAVARNVVTTDEAGELTETKVTTSSSLKVKVIEKTQMCEINPGVWDGLTPDQAKKFYPQEWARFVKDPYAFRAPRAESYHDLSVRLEPILIELEREKEDLLIIGHSSVIRCLLAYLIGLPASEIPAIEIARGDLLEVVPTSYGVHSQAFHFWDGPGRRGEGIDGDGDHEDEEVGKSRRDETNFYENYAEDTKGKKRMTAMDLGCLSPGIWEGGDGTLAGGT